MAPRLIGVIEFPGLHTYAVSSTINAYDGCQIEGTIGNASGGYGPPAISWNGPVAGAVYNVTGFTAAANSAPVYTPSSPSPAAQGYIVTFTSTNSLTAGQWVDIEGLNTAAGHGLNRTIAQVASATGSTFTIAVPFSPTIGTFADSGTATTVNVIVAFDANARYQQSIRNITITNKNSTNAAEVGVYFGSRVDSGTRIWNAQVAGTSKYGFYFANGGINVDFDKGWRTDGVGVAGIYWKIGASDSLGVANGTVDNSRSAGGSSSSGAAVVMDNAASCGNMHFTSRNLKVEVNSSITPGLGAFTLYDCPSAGNSEQFFLNFDTTWVAPATTSTADFNFPSIVMSPANDKALVMNAMNSQFPMGSGSNTTKAFVGIPGLLRGNMLGASGWTPLLSYSPSMSSSGLTPSSTSSPIQLLGDVNIGQLWQNGVQASDFLYSDTTFAALPNATTLFAGQILAPPAYWNGTDEKRYAIDVVYQSGTTGTPNSGATTCTGTAGTSILTCSSATDLSAGQKIAIGTDTNKTINSVDATTSSAVQVKLTSNLASTYSTATALSFSTPLLAYEMQFPTKSSAAPTTLTWQQGDTEQNSGATANGIAAWVNVSSGTPGSWAGIPLGNSSGQITPAQITTPSITVNGTTCTLGSSCAPATAGVNAPAWLQYLGTGEDGAYEATAAHCTLTSPCFLNGDHYYTSFKVDSGAYVYANPATTGGGMVVHATGACTINGTVLVNGAKNAATSKGFAGASSGGSGGGVSAGLAGQVSTTGYNGSGSNAGYPGGTAGISSGGNGGNGYGLMWAPTMQRAMTIAAGALDGLGLSGAAGQQGGNTGGAGGSGGSGAVLMCASMDGTGGVIDASGSAGNPPSSNSTGAGSGGGGGVVILSSKAAVTNWPSVYVAGGPGGLVTVPEAVATGGTCTSQPKVTLGVTAGALSSCAVAQAGAGCGTGAGITWNILGGGGTQTTAAIAPTWNNGSLASCTVTSGDSSGYTAATYTTSGKGGDGGNGWYTEFQGW